jgi:ribosome-binding ATPase
MSLSLGIVGLPNVGKSTLFNALTKKSVLAANYPFATIDPSVGVVSVPDERLELLSKFSQSAKTISAAVEFVDIAGLVRGAAEGEGLGNKFLAHIREVDAIVQVVRIFDDQNILHVHSMGVDPVFDIGVINLELVIADKETVTKRLSNLDREIKKADKKAIAEHAVLKKIESILNSGDLAIKTSLNGEEKLVIKYLNLLTMKPILYVLNKKAGGKNLDEINDERFKKLMSYLENENSPYVIVDAKIEEELKDFEHEEKELFRKELRGPTPQNVKVSDTSISDDGINNLIRKGYELLDLITYFTTGETETRAWTIKKGWTAPEAGTAIHTDFKDKFIRAEVIYWKDLLDAGSFALAREKGLVRTEGKEYVVKDGDVIEFKV